MASTVAGSDSDTVSESEEVKTRVGSPTSDANATDIELAEQNRYDRYVAEVHGRRVVVNRFMDSEPGAPTPRIELDTPTLDAGHGAGSGTVDPTMGVVTVGAGHGEPETPTLVTTPGTTAPTPGPPAEASGSRRRSASEELKRVKQAKNKREKKRKKNQLKQLKQGLRGDRPQRLVHLHQLQVEKMG